MWRAWRLLVACLLGVGCAWQPQVEGPLARIERDPQALVAEVAALRGLPSRRPVGVRFHDRDAFVARLAELGGGDGAVTVGGRGPEQAWPLASGGSPVGPGVTAGALQAEQVIAFYDAVEHAIHVRRPERPDTEQATVWALVHEIGHALQADHFVLPDFERLPSEDARLAALALVEGDPMLTLLAYLAGASGITLRQAVDNVSRRLQSGQLLEAVRLSGTSQSLLRTSWLVRERVLFPYTHGMLFIGAIHRAGGFALVDRVYAFPPASTEQVLHPEKYLAGEGARSVSVPDPPSGSQRLGTGTLGELQLGAMLGDCVTRSLAEAAAAGWAGDSYAVVSTPSGTPALLWSTAWDTLEDAVEFEAALHQSVDCWSPGGALVARPSDGGYDVVREASRVAVVWGFDAAERARLASELVATPVTPAVALPPFRTARWLAGEATGRRSPAATPLGAPAELR